MAITLDTINASFHSIAISDGTDTLAIDASGNITVNAAGGSFAVTATDLDIRALTNADVVTIEDGGGSITVDGTVATTMGGFDSFQVSKSTASTTAAELAATPLASRGRMIIQNLGSQDVYLDATNAVSTDDLMLPKGASMEFPFSATANIWVITASGTSDVRVMEAA